MPAQNDARLLPWFPDKSATYSRFLPGCGGLCIVGCPRQLVPCPRGGTKCPFRKAAIQCKSLINKLSSSSALDLYLHIYRSLGSSYAPPGRFVVGGIMKRVAFVLLLLFGTVS